MIIILSAIQESTGKKVNGYFDTCMDIEITYGGFMRYLKSLGYKNINFYTTNTKLTDEQKKSFVSFQKEFGEAISSTEYYQPCEYHDYVRREYAKAHPINQDFKQPEFKRGGIY